MRPKLTYSESQACQGALMGGYDAVTIDHQQAEHVVASVVAAFYRARYGPAEGSTAYQKSTNRAACRYFDADFGMLRWIIYKNVVRGDLRAERVDELPGVGWDVRERDWQELVQ